MVHHLDEHEAAPWRRTEPDAFARKRRPSSGWGDGDNTGYGSGEEQDNGDGLGSGHGFGDGTGRGFMNGF